MIKAKRDELLAPLAAVSGIIDRRHTLPILSNVLIDGSAETLSFLATDIEIQISARSGLAGTRDSRALTVGARKLLDILRALPEDAEVSLQPQDKRLLVKAGRSRFSLQTLPAEDFPRLAKAAGEVTRFAMPQKALRRLLGLVQYAMAQQDIRYYLNGLLMVVEGGELKLVATDGHRLAFAALPLTASLPRQEAIVPRKTVVELAKLLADSDDEVRIELSAAQAGFSFGSIELVSKLIDGKFPDYTRVIPTGHKNRLQANRALQRLAQRLAIRLQPVLMPGGDDARVVGELAVDQLRDELDRAEAKAGLRGRELDAHFVVAVGQELGELHDGLARHDGLQSRQVCGEGHGRKGETMAVGRHQLELAAIDDRQQAVQVVADVLLGHRVLDEAEQPAQGLLRQREAGHVTRGLRQLGEILGGQRLQTEAAAARLQRPPAAPAGYPAACVHPP